MNKKFVVIVLDGFGVGYMDDIFEYRKQDINANTALNIMKYNKKEKFENLSKMGLFNLIDYENDLIKKSRSCIIGKSKLQHYGADTFLGHQEIMGTKVEKPIRKPFSEYIDKIYYELIKSGYIVEKKGDKLKFLWVNNCVAIGDNLETDLGQVYNVTTSFRNISFEEELKIGNIVRRNVEVARVIVFGGTNSTIESIISAKKEKEEKYIGIDAPLSKVYEKGYMVRHLGYGVNPEKQIPNILSKNNINVTLIGKVADIVINENGRSLLNLVDTEEIFEKTLQELENFSGFMCINVQETDLAGHSENSEKYIDILKKVDQYIPKILKKFNEEDVLVITADHGNDPMIGSSKHTREYVPLLIYNKRLAENDNIIDIGIRQCMSDTAKTVLEFFGIDNQIDQGESYLKYLK